MLFINELGRRISLICLFILPALASAHHGIGGQFDRDAMIELRGEITRVFWRNPHVRISLSTLNENGQTVVFEVEALSVSMLRQRGISGAFLNVGDEVTIAGNPSNRGRNEINLTNVLLPDGREVVLGNSRKPIWSNQALGLSGPYANPGGGDSSKPELGIFRVWSRAPGTSLFRNFDLDAQVTDAARQAALAFDPLKDNATAGECVEKSMPLVMANPYPREFVDQGQYILFRLEENDTVRTVHMGSDRSGANEPASPLGYSVGRWEGDTLVVTTTKVFKGQFARGISLNESLEIVERFTPSDDGSRLDLSMILTDPAAFAEPMVLEQQWHYLPNVAVEPYECAEG